MVQITSALPLLLPSTQGDHVSVRIVGATTNANLVLDQMTFGSFPGEFSWAALSPGTLTYGDFIATTSVGHGIDIRVFLHYSIQPGDQEGNGYTRSGIVQSADVFAFPAPQITPITLRAKGGVVVEAEASSSSYVNVASNLVPIKLVFSGLHFSAFAAVTTVSYSNAANSYTCLVDEMSDTELSCAIQTGEIDGEYVFTVIVDGQTSNTGVDILRFPVVLRVTSVTGCPDDQASGTFFCATVGGERITVTGEHFADGMVCVPTSFLLSCADDTLLIWPFWCSFVVV